MSDHIDHSHVYAELTLGNETVTTEEARGEPRSCFVKWDAEDHYLRCDSANELFVTVRDRRGVRAKIRGDPLIGEGSFRFDEQHFDGARRQITVPISLSKLAGRETPAGNVYLEVHAECPSGADKVEQACTICQGCIRYPGHDGPCVDGQCNDISAAGLRCACGGICKDETKFCQNCTKPDPEVNGDPANLSVRALKEVLTAAGVSFAGVNEKQDLVRLLNKARSRAAAQKNVFVASHSWEEVPVGMALPPGLEVRFDIASGINYARLPPPPKGK